MKIIVSPAGIVEVTPGDLIGTVGENITYKAETDAGPGTQYYWIFDPDYSICINDTSECDLFDDNGNVCF